MTKKELEQRIAALEAQVAMLGAQLAQQTRPLPPVLPPPVYPGTWPQITCDTITTTNPTPRTSIRFTGSRDDLRQTIRDEIAADKRWQDAARVRS